MSEFLWGTATSAHQVEGGNVANDWARFEGERGLAPARDACDFANRFERDLDLARRLGTNAFRFSIEWSRIEPRPGERDARAIDYYERLVAACLERGLAPVVTLVHFTLPEWAAARGGWLAPETHDAFDRHVAFVAERFVGDVTTFVTFNEPNVQAGAGYLSGIWPPGKRLRADLAGRCQAALVRAHARAYRILHDAAERRAVEIRVGAAPHVVAWRKSRWDPLGVVHSAARAFNWAFLDAIESGRLKFELVDEDAKDVKGAIDFVGLNYYMGMEATVRSALGFAGVIARPRGPGTSDMGWPIDAGGFEEVLLEARARYARPIVVTENGIADASDRARPRFIEEHVLALERAARRGAKVDGYFHWSLVDNFEWHEGYAPRFGLFAVDYATQARVERASAAVYRRIIAERRAAIGAAS